MKTRNNNNRYPVVHYAFFLLTCFGLFALVVASDRNLAILFAFAWSGIMLFSTASAVIRFGFLLLTILSLFSPVDLEIASIGETSLNVVHVIQCENTSQTVKKLKDAGSAEGRDFALRNPGVGFRNVRWSVVISWH